jgi:hypothetical protein
MISIAYPIPLLTKLSLRDIGDWHAFLSGSDEEFWLNLEVLGHYLIP